MKRIVLSLTAALALAAAPAAALAQGVSLGAGGASSAGATLSTGPSGVEPQPAYPHDLEVDASTSASAGADANAGSSSAVAPLSLSAADAGSGATLSSASSVQTSADLTAFARGQLAAHPAITGIDAGGDAVTVRFKEPARLFGVIPLTMNAAATIDADGSVTISHPWYYALSTTNTDEAALSAALSAEAAAAFNRAPSKAAVGATSTAGGGSTALSVSEAAQLISGIDLALGSVLAASSSASAGY